MNSEMVRLLPREIPHDVLCMPLDFLQHGFFILLKKLLLIFSIRNILQEKDLQPEAEEETNSRARALDLC